MTIDDLSRPCCATSSATAVSRRWNWTDEDWRQIESITASRYGLWNWNYGRSPQFNAEERPSASRQGGRAY
jgi:lipoate-protein ligase A